MLRTEQGLTAMKAKSLITLCCLWSQTKRFSEKELRFWSIFPHFLGGEIGSLGHTWLYLGAIFFKRALWQ